MKKNYKIWRGLTALLGLILCFAIFFSALAFTREGDVNVYLGVKPPEQEVTGDTRYYKSEYSSKEEMQNALKQHVENVEVEGSVLLKNDDNALPLKSGASVTLFGHAAAHNVFHGGSGGPSNSGVDLYTAMKDEGFKINDRVYDVLKNDTRNYGKKGDIAEMPVSSYDSVKSSFDNDYNDAAIVVLRRYGGEEGELNHGLDGIWEDGEAGVPELALHNDEKDLLNMIKNSGKFDKVIVLVNSGYAMDLGWLDEYGVDACLWIGYPGATGMKGVAKALAGKADPSGRTVDTYATDSLSSPAIQNAGDFTFTNLQSLYKNKYVVYAEGIYVGYKYYETRYQDQVLGINNAASSKGSFASNGAWNYADEMAFTFGSGSSYADFTQELISVDWNRETHEVTAKVKVTNLGDETYGGKSKSVVQLYVQLPWESGQAEKSAIQLVDFGKTGELSKGESEEVTLTFSDYLFATYDENATNGADTSKKGCYTFDAGDYYFAIGDNAHGALNNVLANRGVNGLFDENGKSVTGDSSNAVKFTVAQTDNSTYARSPYTNEIVCNRFEDRDLNYFIKDSVTYLTRGDWNTFPTAIKNITATDKIKDLMENSQYTKPSDAPDISEFKYSQDNGLTLVEMREEDYDSEKWDLLIDQMSVGDLAQVYGDHMGSDALTSVGMPAYIAGDGPDGYQGGLLFNCEVLAASTFNKDLLKERGNLFGEESIWLGYRQIYGPGANIHRTPYAGRNFEYYSEDSIMSFYCGRLQTSEMARMGLVSMSKHFCGNDQETNRHGVATFLTEQTYRQITLKGFEGALAGDNSLGFMAAYNRIGCTPTSADYQTMTTVVRGEWGFKGINITDSSKDSTSYMYTADCVKAGTDLFNNDPNRTADVRKLLATQKDGYLWQCARETAKHYLYAMSRSNLMNGLSKETVVEDFIPWWKTAIVGICIGIGVLTLAAAGMFVYTAYIAKDKKEVK